VHRRSIHDCVIEIAKPDFFESPLARSEFTSKNKEQSKSGTQRFERTMKPLFVCIKEDQRVVHWKKLTAFSVAVMVLTAVLVEGLWWLLSNTLSLGALIGGAGARHADRGPRRRPRHHLPGAGTGGARGVDMTTR